MSIEDNGLTAQTTIDEIFTFLEETYFQKDNSSHGEINFLNDLLYKFLKLHPNKKSELFQRIFQKEIEDGFFPIEILEQRYVYLRTVQNLSLEEKIKFLNLCSKSGSIQKFFDYADCEIDYFLTIKNHQKLNLLIEEIIKINPNWMKPYYAKLICDLEERKLESALETAKLIEEKLDLNWNKLVVKKIDKEKYYQRLLDIIKNHSKDEFVLEKYLMALKLKMFHHFGAYKDALDKMFISRYFLLYKNENEMLAGLFPILKNAVLVSEIKSQKKFNLFGIKKIFPLTYKQYRPNIGNIAKIEDKNDDFTLYELDKSFKVSSIEYENSEYAQNEEIAKLENLYMKQLENIQKVGVFDRKQLFYCFESMGLLNASIMCLTEKDVNVEEFYLYCEVLIQKGDYANCLSEIDTWIINRKLNDKLSIEFKYLKAEALNGLKCKKDAQNLYREVLLENPEYRLVKERVKSASGE